MKKIVFLLSILFFISSCRKTKQWDTPDPNAKQHHDDASNVKGESDASNNEINAYIQGISAFGKNGEIAANEICGASIDSSQINGLIPTLYINFDNVTVCQNPSRIRDGQVKVELIQGNAWSDVGAKLRITYIDYTVKFVNLNNYTLVFNGEKYLTDVNGINWVAVYLGTSTIRLRERCYNMTVTFPNGQVSNWQSARVSDWGYNLSLNQIYATVNGDTTLNGKVIDSWGLTRFGTSFTTEMVQPWKSNSSCGWWRPTQGIYTSVTQNFSITATFGTDDEGNQVNSGCPSYFKIDWNITGGSNGEAVLNYWY